jgi:hypothetical protein
MVAAVAVLSLAGCDQSSSASSHEPALASPAKPIESGAKSAAGESTVKSAAKSAAKPPVDLVHQAPQQVAAGGDGRARNITFDALKFPMDDPKSRMFERKMLTDSIEKLSGTHIRLRGFILPAAFEDLSSFTLVRDNQQCCFGPGSALYDSVMVTLEDQATTKYVTRPVTVEGTFQIKELQDPTTKKFWSIYRITATKVE